MAFEADCGLSTVLEALCVTSTARFLVPGERRNSKLKTENSKLFPGGRWAEIEN